MNPDDNLSFFQIPAWFLPMLFWWSPCVILRVFSFLSTFHSNSLSWDLTTTKFVLSNRNALGLLNRTQVNIYSFIEIPNKKIWGKFCCCCCLKKKKLLDLEFNLEPIKLFNYPNIHCWQNSSSSSIYYVLNLCHTC